MCLTIILSLSRFLILNGMSWAVIRITLIIWQRDFHWARISIYYADSNIYMSFHACMGYQLTKKALHSKQVLQDDASSHVKVGPHV